MANKGGCRRRTRAQGKKRSFGVVQPMPKSSVNKKRISLTETPVISTSGSSPKTDSQKKEEENKVEAGSEIEDIHTYLRKMEAEDKRRPAGNYIDKLQKDVTANMREILVDWLVDVAVEYKLGSDTLYRTVSYIDRFLSVNEISKQRLQLLGVSCMLIAAKYEEINPPKVKDLCDITDNTYTEHEVVKMEAEVLKLLDFEMGSPTVYTFLGKYTGAGQDDCKYSNTKLENMAKYIGELSLLEYNCLQFLPSKVAASAVFLSRFALGPDLHPWSSKLQQQTSYGLSELRDCITVLYSLLRNEKDSSLSAVRDKYAQEKFECVSTLEVESLPSNIPESHFHGF